MARFEVLYNSTRSGFDKVIEADTYKVDTKFFTFLKDKEVIRSLRVDIVLQVRRMADDEGADSEEGDIGAAEAGTEFDALAAAGTLSSAELDALVAASTLSSAELDALVAASTVSSAELDALVAASTVSSAELDALVAVSTPSTAELDALIAAGAVSLAELDRLAQTRPTDRSHVQAPDRPTRNRGGSTCS